MKKNTRLHVILLVVVPVFLSIILSAYRDRVESRPASVGPRYEIKSLQSRILSEFRKSASFHQYSVIYPKPRVIEQNKKLPLVIHIPAFGGDHRQTKLSVKRTLELLDLRLELNAIHVFVDPNGPHSHHYFVDSATNGAVGTAFVQELLPELRRTLPVVKIFLTGHSSGGWSALWLQLEYPTLFDGVWATSPDPIDFRDFYGVDLISETPTNIYFTSSKGPRSAFRGRSGTLQSYIEATEKKDPQNNEWVSIEAAFSPLDSSGTPRQLFDRKTGEINLQVAAAWKRFSLTDKLRSLSPSEQQNFKDKIHLFCGSKDDFFLDAPFNLFCKELHELPVNGSCELIEGRTHSNLYNPSKNAPDGLVLRIWEEIAPLPLS